jgi:uncharacterized protein YkwD
MEVVMELRRSLNTARRHAHPDPLVPTLAATRAIAAQRRRGWRPTAMRRLTLCIVVAAFAVLAVGPTASANAITMTTPERQLLALVNHVRAEHHLRQLTMVGSLERASRAHSREMAYRQYFRHSSFSGESFSARLIRFGYTNVGCTGWTVGENIASGYASSGTPRAIFKAWVNSPAHRTVMLTARFRNVGIGRVTGTLNGVSGIVFFTLDCGARSR